MTQLDSTQLQSPITERERVQLELSLSLYIFLYPLRPCYVVFISRSEPFRFACSELFRTLITSACKYDSTY
ncbi:hypothetical protein LOK49_LG10G01897 [Camellia lanceoleosa]|uniref:Uncharacterized protein n=1 Tax=Camellia lanceoleosa TaxID=1840588 RepID=A0ACC0G743_9ERIC|nr:hypothetical protein LOK49_LG10G01897 [Camellia lanceoleosa]